MTPTQFDPATHPPLTDLGERLRELAGDAAYKAGRDYLRKGRVQDGTVAETAAYATGLGSISCWWNRSRVGGRERGKGQGW